MDLLPAWGNASLIVSAPKELKYSVAIAYPSWTLGFEEGNLVSLIGGDGESLSQSQIFSVLVPLNLRKEHSVISYFVTIIGGVETTSGTQGAIAVQFGGGRENIDFPELANSVSNGMFQKRFCWNVGVELANPFSVGKLGSQAESLTISAIGRRDSIDRTIILTVQSVQIFPVVIEGLVTEQPQ